MRVTSSKQAQKSVSPLNGRGGAGHTLPTEFVAHQFKPGQSGNPNGNRGTVYGEVVKLARQFSDRAVRRLGELMESDDERVAFMAAQALLERAYGKPREYSEPAVEQETATRRAEIRAHLIRLLDEKAIRKHSEGLTG